MSVMMEEEIKRWTARRKSALVLEIIQGKTMVSEASRQFDLAPSEIEEWMEHAKAVVRLTAALGGPLGQVAHAAVDRMIGPAMVAWGVIAEAPVIEVQVTMSKSRAIAELTARMTSLNPKVGELRELNQAIDIQMRKAKIFACRSMGLVNSAT